MEQRSELKSARLLEIYTRLEQGRTLKKADLAQEFHVTQRSIQRDVEDLRCFLAERHLEREVIYDGKQRGYRMVSGNPRGLTNSEILAVCKILLESRSLPARDMGGILDKLIDCAVPQESQKAVRELVANEKLHYIPPHHGQSVLGSLWELGQAIRSQQVVEIGYERMKEPKLVRRRVQPVGIMFSEYYFYLTAFLEDKTDFDNPDDLFPTIYRIDRIRSVKVLNEHFRVRMPSGSRRASSVSASSLCTAGGWSISASATPAHRWRRCWTGSPRRRYSPRTPTAGSSPPRCSARALRCG